MDAVQEERRIRPGFIILVPYDELVYYAGSNRDKLLQYYFGQTERQFRSQGIEFVSLDFDYLAIDFQTEEVVCDFELDERSCNTELLQNTAVQRAAMTPFFLDCHFLCPIAARG